MTAPIAVVLTFIILLGAVACDGAPRDRGQATAAPAATATSQPTPSPVSRPSAPPLPTTATVEERRAHERSFIPSLTTVQRWDEVSVSGKPENFAPSVVRLPDGRYRMYANAGQGSGVVSLISPDGISFTPEPGERLSKTGDPTLDCTSSHPWVVAMDGGWRMYYQGNSDCEPRPNSPPVQYRIFSAFSDDGLTFAREGVRVDVGTATGLRQAAHGRVLRMPDGTFRMYFSADLIGKDGPADLLTATSSDGLQWTVDVLPILERAHDPTVIMAGGKVIIFTTFLGDNFVVLESVDGHTFSTVSWADFFNRAGTRMEEFGDVDVAWLPDGRLAMYGSGKGSRGISTMLAPAP